MLDKSQPSVSTNLNNISTASVPGKKGGLYGTFDIVLTSFRSLSRDQ